MSHLHFFAVSLQVHFNHYWLQLSKKTACLLLQFKFFFHCPKGVLSSFIYFLLFKRCHYFFCKRSSLRHLEKVFYSQSNASQSTSQFWILQLYYYNSNAIIKVKITSNKHFQMSKVSLVKFKQNFLIIEINFDHLSFLSASGLFRFWF